jgi:uncharacterized membrane protein YagU involved in acid resistance
MNNRIIMDLQNIFFGTKIKSGFSFGIIATLTMTLIMLIGMISGMSPIPEPIPLAIAKSILGALPTPALMILGMVAHFVYGGAAGIILFKIAGGRRQFWLGLAWGILLWLIMHLVVLPLIGWGFFALEMNIKIIPATLLLHLIYGAILGWGLQKSPSYSKDLQH